MEINVRLNPDGNATDEEKEFVNRIKCMGSLYENLPPPDGFTKIGEELLVHSEEYVKQEQCEEFQPGTLGNSCYFSSPQTYDMNSVQADIDNCEELISVICKVIKEHLTSFLSMCVERNFKDKDSNSLLHVAAMSGYEDVVCFLVMQGCGVAVRDKALRCALHVACERGHCEVAICLLKRGADKDAKDRFGRTPLHYAVEKGHRVIVETLIQYGADVNALDNCGKSALHLAAELGDSSLVKYLISCKCVHQARCVRGLTPLEYAVKMGHVNTYQVLVEFFPLIDDSSLCKLAILAVRENQVDVLREIVDSDLVSSVEDDCWKEVLKMAYTERRHEAVSVLIEKGCVVDISEDSGWGNVDQLKSDPLLDVVLNETNTKDIDKALQMKSEDACELSTHMDVLSSPEKCDLYSTLVESETGNHFLQLPSNSVLEAVDSVSMGETTEPKVDCFSECTQCHKTFSTSRALQIHSRTHSGERPYNCTQCGKGFTQSGSLLLHLRTHSGERPYKCVHCAKSFSQCCALKVHLRRHTGENPYGCDQCNKKFPVLSALRSHYVTHSGAKPYKCELCDKRFSHMRSLQTHCQVHSGIKAYECKECGKKFGKMCTLQTHARTHNGDRPYECDQCGKRFSQSGSLRIHKRTHTGEKPYGCTICGRKFTQSGSLQNHYKTHAARKSSV